MICIILLLLLFYLVENQGIQCGSGYTAYQTNGEDQYYVCTNVTEKSIFTPSLPRGLTLVDGVIKGTPKRSFDDLRIRIQTDSLRGDWFLTSNSLLTNVGVGFDNQVLFINTPFEAIRCFPNSHYSSFQITPKLSDGLEFNESLGVISGVYTGEEKTVEYSITAFANDAQNVTSRFSLTFRHVDPSSHGGYSVCYYPYRYLDDFHNELYYQLMSVDACVQVNQPLNFTEKYKVEKVHHWPGIPEYYENLFLMKLVGVLPIAESNTYEFHVRGTNGIWVLIDSVTLIDMGSTSASYAEKVGTVVLTAGYHLLTIYYCHYDLDAHLAVQYRVANTTEWIPLSGETLLLGGRSPSFLQYEDISSAVGERVNRTFTRRRMGIVHSFSITPALPEGLHIDRETGLMNGTASVAIHSQFTVTATGPMGSCSTTLSLSIHEKMVQGLHAVYHVVDETVNVCRQLSLSDYQVERVIEKEDQSLSFPFRPRRGFWPSVPAEVFKNAGYVVWDGFILIDEVGEWRFWTVSYDGFRVRVDGEILMEDFNCKGKATEKSKRIEFTQTGLHSLLIEFFTNDDDFVFEMKMMKPKMVDFVDIPKESLFYVPQKAFAMSIPQAKVIVNQSINPIRPILYSTLGREPSFHISPELPPGLIFHANGTITGTPSTLFNSTLFLIEVHLGDSVLQTQVTLESYLPVMPTEISIKNAAGEEVDSIEVVIYKEMEAVSIQCKDEAICAITIQPALPTGITFNSVKGVLEGFPVGSSPLTIYTVTGSSEAGSITKTFSLLIPSCEHGYYFYLNTFGGPYHLNITQGGEVIFKEEKTPTSKYSTVFCIPKKDAILTLWNSTRSTISQLSVVREDGIVFYDLTLTNSFFSEPLEMEHRVKPTLSFGPSSFYFLSKESFTMYYTIEGLSRPLSIHPALPEDLTLNESQKKIYGQFRTSGHFQYTVQCENEAGVSEVVLDLYVGMCPENHQMFFVNKVSSNDDRVIIRRESDHAVVIDRELGYETANEMVFCLEDIPYLLTVSSPTNTIQGVSQSLMIHDASNAIQKFSQPLETHDASNTIQKFSRSLMIHDASNAIQKFSRPLVIRDANNTILGSFVVNSQTEEEIRVHFFTLFKEGQNRKAWISPKTVGSKWNQVDFSDKKWKVVNANDSGFFSHSIKTVYFRYQVYFDERDSVGSVVVYVKASGGFILYVNGEEAVRVNLPTGPVSRDLMAYEGISLRDWFRMSLNPNLFTYGLNLIAVELHCYVSSPASSQILFDMKSYQFTSRTSFLSAESAGVPTGSSNVPDPNSKPETAFFETTGAYWGDGELPAWVRFTFHQQHLEYVNTVVLRSVTSEDYNPTQFTIWGVRNQTFYHDGQYSYSEVKEPLKVVNNYYFFNKTHDEEILYLDTKVPYQAYEIEFQRGKTDSSNCVRLAKIRLYAEKRIWCEENDKWEKAVVGTTVYGKCPFLMVGETTRTCQRDQYTGVWGDVDKSNCLTRWANKDEAFVDLSYTIVNCTLSLWETVKEAFREVLVREVTIKEEEVLFTLPKGCSADGEIPSVCINVRLRPHRLTSEYVKMELEYFNANATGLFYKKQHPSVPPCMTFIPGDTISIHQRLSGKDTTFVTIIVLMIILYIVLLVMYCKKMNSGRDSYRKVLTKKNYSRDTPLLQI